MTNSQFIRRVIILSCHCLRNFAFYKSGWKEKDLIIKEQFFINANNNFLDIGLIEWCKLFADKRGKHNWRKVISEKDAFYKEMLVYLEISDNEFLNYINEIKEYRDKFIAHLDLENIAHIPMLDLAIRSTCFLYVYILAEEDKEYCIPEAPIDPWEYYDQYFNEGRMAVEQYIKKT